MLRRVCANVLFIFFGVGVLSAQNYINDGGRGKSIAFEEPIVIENGKNIKSSFSQIFRNRLQSVWLSNSAMEVVAKEDLEKMIAVQRKSQDARHSDDSAIEAGRFIAELFSASSTIEISSPSNFRVRIKIVDNAKGSLLVNWQSPLYENQDDFLNYAANDVALHALPILGVELSSLAKSSLGYRRNNDSESIMEARGRVDNLSLSIAELDRQLSEMSRSKMHNLSAVAEKARLESEKEQLKIQEREAKDRLKRLEEDEKRLEEDRQKAKNRSEELNKKIEENGIKYDKIAEQKRKEYSNLLTANARIGILEKKKQTLLNLKNDTLEKIEKYYFQEDTDLKDKVDKIEAEPYSLVEKDEKGRLTKSARKERDAKIALAEQIADERKQKYLEEQYLSLSPAYEAIRGEINEDIAHLKEQKESSLLNSSLLRFGNYDGAKKAWVAYISLILAGEVVSNEKILIPYKNVVGREARYRTDAEKNAYNTTVEEYNSYFANNIPIIYVEINYDITALSPKKPSQYKVKIKSYVFKNIERDNVIFTIKASSSSKTLSIMPQVPLDYSHVLLSSHLESEMRSRIKTREKYAKKNKERIKEDAGMQAKSQASSKDETSGEKNEKDSPDGEVKSELFRLGYIPLGVDFGLSYVRAPNMNLGINAAYLFYTKFFDVGPEAKIFFSPKQFDFAVTAKMQRQFLGFLYVAGNAGIDFFSKSPRVAFIIGAEVGYIFLLNWSVSIKMDISTQPQYLFRISANYYFK